MSDRRCHFCGDEDSPHMLADCRPDLVEHEVGPDCTWWTSWQLYLETGDEKKYGVTSIEQSCYAYQNPLTLEAGTEHKYFYSNVNMTGD